MNIASMTQDMRNELLRRALIACNGVMDLGSHRGAKAEYYARLRKNVLWVEAIPEIWRELNQRVSVLPNQRAVCALLDSADGVETRFRISSNGDGVSSSLFEFGEYASGPKSLWPELSLEMICERTFLSTTLDALLRDSAVNACEHEFWELDLQGSELRCLQGASEALTFAQAIHAETSTVSVYQGGVLLPELDSFLKGAGFIALWEPTLPHDSILFVRPSLLSRIGYKDSDIEILGDTSFEVSQLQRSYQLLKQNSTDLSSFCAAPFIQLLLDPYGQAYPCGMLNTYPLGDIVSQSIEQIWNGPKLQALRSEFLSGAPRTCGELIRSTSCNKCFSHFNDLIVRTIEQPDSPRRLDVRLNGRCNLECVMCNVWKQPNGTYDASRFWADGPSRIFPALEEVCVLGGEPFVQRDTFRLIKEVSRVNGSCNWSFTTNCQWKLTFGIRSALDLIRIRVISVSIDSLKPEVYASIRKNGKLALTLRTLNELSVYREERASSGRSPFELCMRMVIRSDNYTEVPDFCDYARARGIYPDFSLQRFPRDEGSLMVSSAEIRERALEILMQCINKKGVRALQPIVGELMNSITTPTTKSTPVYAR